MGLYFGGHTTANSGRAATKRGELHHKSCDTPEIHRQPASHAANPAITPGVILPMRLILSEEQRREHASPTTPPSTMPEPEPRPTRFDLYPFFVCELR